MQQPLLPTESASTPGRPSRDKDWALGVVAFLCDCLAYTLLMTPGIFLSQGAFGAQAVSMRTVSDFLALGLVVLLAPILKAMATIHGRRKVALSLRFTKALGCLVFVASDILVTHHLIPALPALFGSTSATVGKALFFVAIVMTEGFGAVEISQYLTVTITSDLYDTQERALRTAVVTACLALSVLIGPAIGGRLYTGVGTWAPFVAAMSVALLSLVCTAFLPETQRTEEQEAQHLTTTVARRELLLRSCNPLLEVLRVNKLQKERNAAQRKVMAESVGLPIHTEAFTEIEAATEPEKGIATSHSSDQSVHKPRANYNLMWLLTLVFILNTGEHTIMTPSTFYMSMVFQMDAAQTGMVLSVCGVVGVLSQVVGAKLLTPTLGPRNVIILITMVMAVLAVVMGTTSSVVVFVSALIGNSVFFLTTPMYYQLASLSTQGDEINMMFSAIASIRALSQLTGKSLGGWLLAIFTGPSAPLQLQGFFFFVSGLLSVLVCIISIVFLRDQQRRFVFKDRRRRNSELCDRGLAGSETLA